MNSLLRNTVSLVVLTVSFLAPAEAFAGYYYSRTYIKHTTVTTTRTVPPPPVVVRQVAPCGPVAQVAFRPCVPCRPCRRVVFRPCGGRRVRCFY